MQNLNISPDNNRFLYGCVHNEDIYNTKIEDKKTDEIICFEVSDTYVLHHEAFGYGKKIFIKKQNIL